MAVREPTVGPRPLEYAVAFAAYALAGGVLLYPVFANPGSEVYSPESLLSRPVARWVMWVLSWDVHALITPARLFDANVFHPVPDAMAFGDALLGALPLFAPPYLLGGNPMFAYQFLLLATLAACGAGAYCLARHCGAGVAGAAIGGLVYAYCPVRIGVLAELGLVSLQFLPLALLYADRVAVGGRWRDALLLFLFAAWQMLCGAALAYASLIVLAVYLAVAALSSWRGGTRRWRGTLLAVAAWSGATAVFVLSFAPYRQLLAAALFDSGRTLREFASFDSAVWRAYLVPPYLASRGIGSGGGALYLGIPVLLLAAAGVAGVGRRMWPLLAVLALSLWMSLGPDAGGGWLAPYRLVLELPGYAVFGAAPSRFALLAMIPIAVFAALGVERLRAAAGARRLTTAASAAIALLVLVDYRLPFQHFATQRVVYGREEMPLYATLAELPPGPVLELPVDACAVTEANAVIARQLGGTLHWKPLLDGYRSNERAPAVLPVVHALANALPDTRALALLRRSTGLQYLVAHLTEVPGDWRHRWRQVEGMTRLGFFGQDLLFDLKGEVEADLRDELLELPRHERTLSGVPLAVLGAEQRAASLRFTELPPRVAVAGNAIRAAILVENRSPVAWPALTTDRGRAVFLSYLWADEAGNLAGGNPQAQMLPLDLAPGESVVVSTCVDVPAKTGDLELAFGLSQGEQWFPDTSETVGVRVVP